MDLDDLELNYEPLIFVCVKLIDKIIEISDIVTRKINLWILRKSLIFNEEENEYIQVY
tara:strand:- start:311 stop:484 length:174 start_codon:yes stop_codon:yes gene_type:complete